ncbi:transmembrane channel-like protein 6 isoform X2 [Strigops habroptila]|uniref:transmembrane channel-like protein 6 isoform X2 n=1 Tax=Strigops habroptila TaxID=2489341 RepID=UPI0011CEF967|nr:transmembrane channel-like protein 6 isoform X2 [Strigops habroptila]XP_030361878.1 transmembrane channel-like protein 6 isoform X2 [Strigops habroptila]
MSQPPSFTLHVSEDTGSDGCVEEPSPDNEGALHTSFHQLIQEQSSLMEAGLELEMQERGREPLVRLAPLDTSAAAWPETGQGKQRPGYSSASLRIVASMPSRTIGRSRGAIISQYYNRTARLRRRSSRPPLQQLCRAARPSLRLYDLESDPAMATLQEKRSLLVKELLSLSPSQRSHMLLTVPLCLAEKRALRQELSGQRGPLRHCTQHQAPSPCGGSKDHIVLCCRELWYRLLSLLPATQPWHYALKQISGRFGSSVLSYFLFLKTLLLFNIISFLILLVFVVALQAVYPPASANPQPFTGLELLTGAGYFTHSLLYYGYYSNTTLNSPCTSSPSMCHLAGPPLPYNMPLAYVSSVGVSFLITCILLVYSMSRSFGESYCVGSSSRDLPVKVFCAWDFKVVQRRSVKLQCENICTQLKELLAEQRSRSRSRSLCQRLGRAAVLLLAWLLSLGTVLGCAVAVHHFSQHMHTVQQDHRAQGGGDRQQEALLLALPLVVSVLNAVMPHLYNLLAAWERQDSPGAQVYVAICRNLILKMVVLGLLCYQWLSRRVVCSMEECWETCVGQDLYRFVVMDFVFTLLDTLLGELVWRLVLEKRLKRNQKPEFDIARNVLELIYGQTLTWLGVLFAPLLPAVQVLKLLLLFYIKKTSLMHNCQSPSKPWQASHMSTVFITLLCFPSFLGAAVFLSYTIWSEQPSETCGPFQGLETIYKSWQTWVQVLEKSNPNITWFAWAQQHLVENPFLLFFMSGVLLAGIYFNIQVVRGQRRVIRLLKEQIANEGEDKAFLIQKLHSVYEQRERRT